MALSSYRICHELADAAQMMVAVPEALAGGAFVMHLFPKITNGWNTPPMDFASPSESALSPVSGWQRKPVSSCWCICSNPSTIAEFNKTNRRILNADDQVFLRQSS